MTVKLIMTVRFFVVVTTYQGNAKSPRCDRHPAKEIRPAICLCRSLDSANVSRK